MLDKTGLHAPGGGGKMPIYLMEQEAGFDDSTVGFPSLQTCVGIVLHTSRGLYGFHHYSGNAVTGTGRGPAYGFAQFVQNRRQLGELDEQLFSSNDRRHRGQDLLGWQAYMRQWATALGYTGWIYGFDISQRATKISPTDSTYVEYRRLGGQVRVLYKRWSKIVHTDTKRLPGLPIQQFHPTQGLKDVTGKSGVTGIAAKTSLFHSGVMHEVPNNQFDSFHT